MGKAPSFQFYPGDWQNDLNLQSCSLTARGLWTELLCLMHRSEKYGHLLINGQIPRDEVVANLVRSPLKTFRVALKELTEKNVARRDESGAIFSKRMVEDQRLREIRKACGAMGGNPSLLNRDVGLLVNQKANQIGTPSSSSSISSSTSTSKKKEERKSSAEKDPPLLPSKLSFGEFGRVLLTEEEHKKLKDKFGEEGTKDRITDLDTAIESKGLKYKSHYATILNWDRRNQKNGRPAKSNGKPGNFERVKKSFQEFIGGEV